MSRFTATPVPLDGNPKALAAAIEREFRRLGGSLWDALAIFPHVAVPYSASMTPDVNRGLVFIITATDANAFAVNAPLNPAKGQRLTVRIRNTSGGALGVATWNAVYKMASWTQPGNGNSRAITFDFNGSNWIENSRTPSDVPN